MRVKIYGLTSEAIKKKANTIKSDVNKYLNTSTLSIRVKQKIKLLEVC